MDPQSRDKNNLRCPCYNVQEEFQKIVDTKNSGLTIYLHRLSNKYQLDYVRKESELLPTANNNANIFVLHNTKDTDILSADLMMAFDKYGVSCPRCAHIIENAKKMMEMVPKIEKHDIIGICNNCRKKLTTCIECDKAVKRFVTNRDKSKDVKQYFKSYISKIHRLFAGVIGEQRKFKENNCTPSDMEIYVHHNTPTSPQEPVIADVFDLEEVKSRLPQTSLSPGRSTSFRTSPSRYQKRTTFLYPANRDIPQTRKDISYSRSLDSITYHDDQLLAHDNAIRSDHDKRRDFNFRHEKPLVGLDFKNKKLKNEYNFLHRKTKTDSYSKLIKPSLKGVNVGKSMPDIQTDGLDEMDSLSFRYNSVDDLFRAITSAMEETPYSDFSYYFPKEVDVKLKKPVKIISSSELINDTQSMLRDRAEKERMKQEEEAIRKQEEKEKQKLEKMKKKNEKERLLAEEQLKKLEEEAKKLVEKKDTFSSVKLKQDKVLLDDKKPSMTLTEPESKTSLQKGKKQVNEKKSRVSIGDKMKVLSKPEKGRQQSKPDQDRQKQKNDDFLAKTELNKQDFKQSVEPKQDIEQLTKADSQKPKIDDDIKKNIIQTVEDNKRENEKAKEVAETTDKQKHGKDLTPTKISEDIRKGKSVKDTDVAKTDKSASDKQNDVVIKTKKEIPKIAGLEKDSMLTSKVDKAGKNKTETDNKEKNIDTEEKFKNNGTGKIDKAAADEFKKLLAEQTKQKELEQKLQEEEERKAKDAAEKKLADSPKKVKNTLSKKSPKKTSPKKVLPPSSNTQKRVVKSVEKDLSMRKIKMREPSGDDLLLKLVKLHQSGPRKALIKHSDEDKIRKLLERHKGHKDTNCPLCTDSDIQLELDSILNKRDVGEKLAKIIIGEKIYKHTAPMNENVRDQQKSNVKSFDENILNIDTDFAIHQIVPEQNGSLSPLLVTTKGPRTIDPEPPKGIIRYALSDRSFIDKGWTLLPTEKVVRRMNVYRMRPAHPEFDWFEHNKSKRLMQYDSGEKLAEFDEKGRGRWFYKNGGIALDYYDAEETNAQQRFVIYSSGEPDERGRYRPFTILATFDYLGNGVVFDHAGKIRLKYNQTEGVVLDRAIGPVSHWKWHTLNDPPVLQQVMIDTQMPYKDPTILKLGKSDDNKPRPDNEEMLAIEFDNFIKEKSKKLTQTFKPFQIKMKALKINEQFSLKVLDQATIYLIFRDGSANLKLNLGMILDHKEIVDTDTAEVSEVSNSLERLPARTDSIAGLQSSVAHAQRIERMRVERERRLRPQGLTSSVDQLTAAASRPMKPPFRTVSSDTSITCVCKCRKPSSSNLYYDTRLV